MTEILDIKRFNNDEILTEVRRRMEIDYIKTIEPIQVEPINQANPDVLSFNYDIFKTEIEKAKSKDKPFGSVFSAIERERVKYLVDLWLSMGYTDIRHIAYSCATVRKECGPNFMPVREGGWNKEITDAEARYHVRNRWYGNEINGHVYYGRGYVQLSLHPNYVQEGIADNPDKALEREWSGRKMFQGLLDGRWNKHGKGLMFYLDQGDAVQARRTVNVLDDAEEVAGWYHDFLNAFTKAAS